MNDFDQPGFQDEPKKQEPINNLKAALSRSVLEQEIKEKYGKEKKKVEEEAHGNEADLKTNIDHASNQDHLTPKEHSKHPNVHPKYKFDLVVEGFHFTNVKAMNVDLEAERHIKGGLEAFTTIHLVDESKMGHRRTSVTGGGGLMLEKNIHPSLRTKVGGFLGVSGVKETGPSSHDAEHHVPQFASLTLKPVPKESHSRFGGEGGLILSLEVLQGPLKGLKGKALIERGTDPYEQLMVRFGLGKSRFGIMAESSTIAPLTAGVSFEIDDNKEIYLGVMPAGKEKGVVLGTRLRW